MSGEALNAPSFYVIDFNVVYFRVAGRSVRIADRIGEGLSKELIVSGFDRFRVGENYVVLRTVGKKS